MNLDYEVYYSQHYWWFRLMEVDRFCSPVSVLYRRRYKTSESAHSAAEQAIWHEREKFMRRIETEE